MRRWRFSGLRANSRCDIAAGSSYRSPARTISAHAYRRRCASAGGIGPGVQHGRHRRPSWRSSKIFRPCGLHRRAEPLLPDTGHARARRPCIARSGKRSESRSPGPLGTTIKDIAQPLSIRSRSNVARSRLDIRALSCLPWEGTQRRAGDGHWRARLCETDRKSRRRRLLARL